MKIIKQQLKFLLVLLVIFGCTQDDDNSDIINQIEPPKNIAVDVTVTQDNTGLVTMRPSGEGVTGYVIDFGDGSEVSDIISPGENISHTYEEGVYDFTVTANGLTDETTSITQELVVSFEAPQNLVVQIENDLALSKTVNVTANADFATFFEVDFGEVSGAEPLSANIGETISYTYQEEGVYTITVEALGAAIETTTYSEDFEVTAIVQPIASAATPPARAESDVISIFSSAYNNVPGTDYFPDWGQGGQGSSWALFDLNGDEMLQYINLSYQGIVLADGVTVDVSQMEYLHLDVWTAEDVTDIETSLINNASGTVTEAPASRALTPNDWTSIDIPISEYTDQGLTVTEIFQLKFVGTPWAEGTVFIDNIYFWRTPTAPSPLVGTWVLAPEAGALAVGPAMGDTSWWSCDATCVADRACQYDDEFIFGSDGSFTNVLGTETWVETWQGGSDACGTPVAPYDGNATATFVHNQDNGTVTISGSGAYIGIPKANNEGELPNVAVPESITYDVTFLDSNTISVVIEAGAGVFWQYKLVRSGAPSPLVGTWVLAPEAGSLAVGPALGDTSWWSCDAACIGDRACQYDDQFVFGSDGSFSNVLGSDTWVEAWQGGSDACAAPVAPYDGIASATYSYDESAGTVTINGTGAYIGIPKANNEGELPNVAVPSSITYTISFESDTAINVSIESGAGVFWQYKLVKI
ncbi:hypothetical protein [Winogradskyella sp. SYSU M77433]|uniref:hypothetical protein n=1 Tax=Winogradskyella sp. SYSU M77433 TaxID=3042722 RepID=UPI002480B85A|nr:hypothetical protein [Winogradskyella sp. SYSU M77433]MDH7911659.1 hypothetical protein [Winogradskyella sp. SYSU M77433]